MQRHTACWVSLCLILLAGLSGCGAGPGSTAQSAGRTSAAPGAAGATPPAGPMMSLIVDPKGAEGPKTVADALKKAAPKATIKIKPGTYTAGWTVDKDVAII